MSGIVSIGSKDGAAVTEARRRIELILDPPTAEVGAVYEGRVVNITKFGAFVNILPGRDGLIHISKLGQGKRIDRVEDVLALGDELSVRVDDIDQNGKLSLSLVGDDTDGGGGGGGRGGNGSATAPRAERRERPERSRPRPERPERARSARRWRRRRRSRDRVVRGVLGGRGARAVRRPRPGRGSRRPAAPRWRRGGDRGGARRGGRAAAPARWRRPASLTRYPRSTERRVSDDDVRRTRLASGLRVVTESLPGCAVGDDRRLGRQRRARRGARASRARATSSSTCCSRAPTGARRARSRRRSSRSAAR